MLKTIFFYSHQIRCNFEWKFLYRKDTKLTVGVFNSSSLWQTVKLIAYEYHLVHHFITELSEHVRTVREGTQKFLPAFHLTKYRRTTSRATLTWKQNWNVWVKPAGKYHISVETFKKLRMKILFANCPQTMEKDNRDFWRKFCWPKPMAGLGCRGKNNWLCIL